MSKKVKRRDYRRPQGTPPPTAGPPAGVDRPDQPGRPVRTRDLGDWWPLVVAAGSTLLVVIAILLANQGSPPLPTVP